MLYQHLNPNSQEEIELFYNHDHINAIKLEKAAWETADSGRAERARKLRLEVS